MSANSKRRKKAAKKAAARVSNQPTTTAQQRVDDGYTVRGGKYHFKNPAGGSEISQEKALMISRLNDVAKWAPHRPYAKQAKFLLDESRDCLYGGAAGGGKSDALLMAALQYVDTPGYAAILFRKSYADLSQPGALMDRAREWFTPHKPRLRWNEVEHKWTFPSGATISFAYIDKQNDHLKYQGAEFQFIGFDELTQFKERQFRYLFSRLRKVDDPTSSIRHVPLRMRAATNPGGPGHHWVYMRYVKPWEDWNRRRLTWANTPEADRVFLGEPPALTAPRPYFHPATIEDNPFLNTQDYDLSLDNLDQITKAQLRKGDWQIKPDGRMFKRTWFKIIGEAPTDVIKWVRWWDLAATAEDPDKDPDYTVGCLMGRTAQGMLVIKHVVRIRKDDYEVEQAVAQAAAADGRNVMVGMNQDPAQAGKAQVGHYRRVVVPGYQFTSALESGDSTTRAKPYAGRAGAGDVLLVAGTWVNDFLDEHEVFPDGEHDDQVIAASMAYLWLSGKLDRHALTEGIELGDDLGQSNPWHADDYTGWAAA